MGETGSFKTLQYQFASHLRNPAEMPSPEGIEDRRMQIYRDLFYNNVEGFISNGFPVLRSLISDEKWHRMVRDFFSAYRCQSPYFLEISQEFLSYLQTSRQPEPDDYPFMLELAHYEWVELAADTDVDEIPATGFNPEGNLMQGRPLVSPLAYVVSYQYPVHRISVDFIPAEPPAVATFLIVYRDRQDEVRFMEINGVTARLLMLLEENPEFTGADAVQVVADELAHLDKKVVLQGGEDALKHLQLSGIILGTELKPV
ncbi:MAG: DUF2063 domain-containing protein [Ketobacter sp.]|nr:MAG: DUF2063 domain-containing protein [Ketobacter sp.]